MFVLESVIQNDFDKKCTSFEIFIPNFVGKNFTETVTVSTVIFFKATNLESILLILKGLD